jgi:hypothetical protein
MQTRVIFVAFAKLQKATISFVMSVRPRGTTRLPLDDFHEIWDLSVFRKAVVKIEFSLPSHKNKEYLK